MCSSSGRRGEGGHLTRRASRSWRGEATIGSVRSEIVSSESVLQTYEAGVFETCCNFWREGDRDVRVGGCGGSFIVQRRMVAVCHCPRNEWLLWRHLRQTMSKISAGACDGH